MRQKDYRQRRMILAALDRMGNATIRKVATALGPEWLARSKLAGLRLMLLTMEREHLVTRMGAGVFRSIRWGRSEFPEEIIRDIISLFGNGGTAGAREIQEALTDHNVWAPDERDARHRHILQTMVESGRFCCLGGDQWCVVDQTPTCA